MMQYLSRGLFVGMIIAAIFLAACGQASPTPAPAPVSTQPPPADTPLPPPASPSPAKTEAPVTATTESAPTPSQAAAAEASPAQVQEIEFQADDGQTLKGRYYPAAVNPAPLVVLMHWAPGDQNEWNAIAPWLQNRGQAKASKGNPWLDASWFPPMLEGQSFAVFTFTFRNCEGGCTSFNRASWLLDAQAAMRKAHELQGIDPKRIVAVGASIGADGASDGCAWLNTQFPDSCLGAFSLSAGNYLTVPYKEAVSALGAEQPPKPAWCLYSEGDSESVQACEAANGGNYRSIKYTGDNHGMYLLQPDLKPSALQLMLDFLKLAFGL